MRSALHIGIGSALVAALGLGAAAPAAAGGYHGGGYYRGYHDHGSGFGDFLLGAALVGGIAAIATAASAPRAPVYSRGYAPDDGPRYDGPPAYDNDGRSDPRDDGRGYADAAADQCARAAERAAQSDGGFARAGIDRVQPFRDGARVFGTLAIEYRYEGVAPERAHTRFDCTTAAGRITGLRLG